MQTSDPPNVSRIPCGGGCGAEIQVPEGFAALFQAGRSKAPLCAECLKGQRLAKPVPVVSPAQPSAREPELRQAAGPVPQETTLIARRVLEPRGKDFRVRYIFELHPCEADRIEPPVKTLSGFGRALADYVGGLRQGKSVTGKRSVPEPPPGVLDRARLGITRGSRLLGLARGLAFGKKRS